MQLIQNTKETMGDIFTVKNLKTDASGRMIETIEKLPGLETLFPANVPAVPKIDGAGLVVVCAWCYPGQTLFADYPWLKGRQLSHGICPAHVNAILAEIKLSK
jgi:hypothetical protein